MTGPLLEVENLRTHLYAGDAVVRAVDGVSFSVPRAMTFALLGESGCGKSMTALSIMRLLPEAGEIVAGSVRLGGEEILALPETAMREVRGGRMGMIFQEPGTSLNPVLTVAEQIGETVERHTKLRGAAVRERAVELLNAVGIPDAAQRAEEYPFQFSGGMKQRVMIAAALAANPELLIADEPTTALDVTIQAQVLALLRKLRDDRGMGCLLITHDLGVVSEMAHYVGVMYAGEIVETAPRSRFFAHPAHPYSRKLFASLPARGKRGRELEVIRGTVPPLTKEFTGCRFADRCDYAWELCRVVPPPWFEAGPEQKVRCYLYSEEGKGRRASARGEAKSPPARGEPEDRETVLKVNDIKVHFPIRKGLFKRIVGQVKAVDGVSLTIARGRTLALVGESGSGKTTVGKAILRLLPATAGSVQFNGTDLSRLSASRLRQARSQFQIVFQDPYSSLNPRMRVKEIVEEGMRALSIEKSRTQREARIDELLARVGLSPEAKYRYPHAFSGGQRQRIAIARALAVDPRLIVCDEPTSALDVSVQAQILNLLRELQRNFGLAYLFITHNISVVEFLAHEVAVLYLGRIVERGTVDEVLNHPKHPYTQALLSAVPTIEKDSGREIIRLQGDLPSPVNPPRGCHFHPRCPQVMAKCREEYPGETRFSETHSAHCHLY
jgi:peptide/nickel transport system ATP-binding protein